MALVKARLRRRDFDRICSRSPADRTRFYKLFAGEGLTDGGPRLGVSVSRRIGNAVVRNRVRRRLKEAFSRSASLAGGKDVVIVAKPGIENLRFSELCGMLERSLEGAAGTRAGQRAR